MQDNKGADLRFEVMHDISEWNGKYRAQIGFQFQRQFRNTDIPGTRINKDYQRNGRDFDVFIDSNSDFCKKSLTSGMIDMKRFHSNRDRPDKLYKVNGKTNFEGIGNRSDPWSYCPENIRVAHHKLSTSKNQAGVVPFGKQLARTQHNSIYGRKV